MQPAHRPVFLNLMQIRLPVAAVMSIAHRAAGVLLFLAIPLIIGLLSLALSGDDGFVRATQLLQQPWSRLVLFLLLWALAHHFLAGIRYLLLDLHLGVRAPYFRRTAWAVLGAAPVLALMLLWGLA
ncbi:succinate dehydrogenase, cytochrome b556 subunit [Thiolapillus brandeum]|uniref:Succinate dehydrogenase cytochrome b556 subunit n=1 Tax=Thiolapillus brandeum TaxID=1076588 RepID=A0A7U6JGR4_9GAMM|nr:succinate dehydrogenase, cytochrome b556 subunit [Thiolapillus brandeum]BAO43794.1 succinate dehydrogenase cytochrome b-556 subunit [Thiolapillus brandeum]